MTGVRSTPVGPVLRSDGPTPDIGFCSPKEIRRQPLGDCGATSSSKVWLMLDGARNYIFRFLFGS